MNANAINFVALSLRASAVAGSRVSARIHTSNPNGCALKGRSAVAVGYLAELIENAGIEASLIKGGWYRILLVEDAESAFEIFNNTNTLAEDDAACAPYDAAPYLAPVQTDADADADVNRFADILAEEPEAQTSKKAPSVDSNRYWDLLS